MKMKKWIFLFLLVWIYTIFHYIHGAFLYKGYGDFFLILNDVRLWHSTGVFKYYFGAYPPFYFLLMTPFAFLSDGLVIFIMHFINQVLLLGLLIWLFSTIDLRRYKWLIAAVFLPLVLNFRPLLYTLSMLKIEIMELFLIVGAYVFWKKKKDYLTGTFIAIAGMIKILPYIFFLYFLWKRQWKVVWSIILVSLLILAISCSIFGFRETTGYFIGTVQRTTDKENICLSWYENQSITGWVCRLFSNLKESISRYHPKVTNRKLANSVSIAVKIFLLILLGFLTRKPIVKRDSLQFDYEFSFVLIAMLLLNPFSRDYYSVFLIPVYVLMGRHIRDAWGRKDMLIPMSLMVLSYILIGQGVPLSIIRIFPSVSAYGDNFFAYLHYSVPTYGYFVLLLGIMLLMINTGKNYQANA